MLRGMRRGLLLLLLLGLFLLLPAWPPLLKGLVDRALPLLGFRGSVGEVSGHLLLGLRLRWVELEGEGIRLQAEEVDLFYDLLGLLRREFPLALTLRKARLRLTWEALIPEKPGPPPAVRVVFRSLRLEEVEAELPRGKRLFLPSMRLSLVGENPYRFLARLPGGSFQGEAKALSPDLSAWEVAYAGEVRGLAFFYEGLKGGRLFGVFQVGPSGMEGRARVEGGVVELVGFPLTGVEGEVLLRDERVEAVLKGVGLEGPLRAKALVDLKGHRYRFQMEGLPKLPALARHYGLTLPLEGEGRLSLEGEGWEAVRVRGRFAGEGRLLGEPFRHRGTLAFDRVFTLEAKAEGRLFDRDYALSFALRGGRYGGSLEDTLGSRLALEGEGSRLRVRGRAAWPRPLEGLAAVDFRQEGKRWRLGLQSPGVRLPLFAPLDLSGEVRGEGEKVAGRLGPLGLSGTWGSLALTLAPTPMVVGSLEGEGRLLGGRLSAELRYDAPYARFPLSVRQEAWGFRFQSPYGEGSYRGGALALTLRGLPIRALDEMRLYGKALYREGGLSGRLFLKGRYLELEAGLRRLGADLAGRLLTPLGEVPLKGRYDPGPGLLLEGLGLGLTYKEGLRLQGQGELGGVGLRADLAYREGFSGFLDFATPYGVSGRVLGQGKRLALKVFGLLEGEGEVYPEVRLAGRLLPPLPEGLSLPPLTFRLTREGAEVLGVGRVAFAEGFPFRLDLPFRYRGAEGRLLAQGGLEGGRFTLSTPYGEVKGEGPWRRLGLVGGGEVPALGAWSLKGSMDLPTLAYRGEVGLPKGGLRLALSGKGASLRFLGRASGLRVLGGYEGGLSLLLQAEGYDLTPFGLPARAFGTWGHRGGRMRLATSFGEALFQGEELLSARIRLSGPYLEGEGRISPEGASLTFRGAYKAGGLEVLARGEGGGPWGDLRFQVLGEAQVPHLDPMAFGGEVRTAGGIRYRLLGPVSLEGEGVRYRGHLDLPLALLGKAGRLSGSFQGEGLKVVGEGEGSWAGLAFSWRGAYGDKPSLNLRLPGGEAHLEGREVVLALEEVAPLAEALGVSLTRKAWARLALSGEGEGEAALRLGQEALAATYRGTLLSLVLPERGLGLSWDWREGKLKGLGALEGEGAFRLGEEASGAFRYRGVEVGFAGPLSALKVQARYREEALGEAWLRGVVDLLALKGEGEVGYASAYAEGEGRFAFSGSRYEGEGRLRSLRYLVQEGPFRFSGEGLEAEALWKAPMAFSARYEDGLSLRARGRAEVEGFQVEADLAHGPEGYRGSLKAVGRGLEVRALGEGPLRFQVLGEGLKAEGEASGLEVFGTLGFSRAWGKARLEAGGRFSGRLPELSLEGEGALVGEGKRLPFAFRYRGAGLDPKALSLFGEGEGYRLALEEGRLSLELDQDLTPFGLPARLRASADGPLANPVAVVLERPEGRLSGKVWPWPLRAELKGEVLGEGVEARYEGSLALRFLGPHLRGEARYGEGLLGALTFRYPLLEGEVDLGEGRFTLRGEGGLGGRVEGAFCLPRPLGKCPGLRADLEGNLTYGASAFSGRYAYRAQEGFLGELTGEGRLATPYGAVRLLGRGAGLDLQGEGLPLEGRLELFPLALTYRYGGPLPQGLGALWAEGTYPGPWLLGTYRYGDLALELKGLPGFRVALAGEGFAGEVGLEGVRLVLEGFRLGPLALSGRAEGPFSGAHVDLSLSAFGREARAVGRVGTEGLALAFSGDLEGQVSWKEAWGGRLAFREGWVEFAGKGLPEVRGEVLGVGAALLWPRLEVSGLEVDLLAREARGETALFGLTARGEGKEVRLGYRVPGLDLPLEGRLDLSALALELTSPKGEGALRYGEGRVSGRLALELGGFFLDLVGAGDRVRLVGRHPASPWWAAGAGSLLGEVDLQGAYRLDYRAGPQALTLTGRLLEARLVAEGPYLSGGLTYPAGGELEVDLPLAPLGSRFGGRVHGEGYRVEGVLAGGVGRIGVKGRLLPLEGELTLEETALEDFLARYAPYLKGRVSGRLRVAAREAQGEVAGFVEVSGKRLPLSLRASLAPGRGEGEGRIGESPFRLGLEGDRVALAGEGFAGEVGLEGVRLVLEGFRLGPLALSGRAEGPFSGAHVDLSLSAFGREARAVGRVGTEGLALAFSGDLEGQVSWKEAWGGRLAFREGWVEFAGKGLPEVRGEVLGVGAALLWPRLEVSGLEVDLLAREARGETALFGLTARGEGKEVRLGYRVPGLDLPLEGRLDLSALALELTSPKGEGALRYGEGRVSGRLALELGGFFLDLVGAGDRVRLVGRHPASPWWAAGAGSLLGEVDLQGAYRLDYRAGPQALTLTGRLLEARLVAEGPYLSGGLTYPAGGELEVDLPLAPLGSRFGGRVHGEGYRVEGVLAGGVGRIGVKGRLLPLEGELTLEETALEDFLARYAPYLKGRVSGRLRVAAREAQGEVAGFVEVSGKRLPLSLRASLAPGRGEGEGRIGESPFRLGLEGDRVALAGEGFAGEVGLEGVRLVLEGFRLGPLALSGRAEGPFSGAHVDLSLSAFGREARAVGRVGTEGLALAFSGDLEGQVSWKEAWGGRLAFREGWVEFAGKGLPEVRGEVLGVGAALLWPRLEVSGLEVDLLAREARGETALFGLTARGEGKEVRLGYRVPGLDLPLEGRLDLSALALELTSPKGEGALRYGEGRVSGRLALELGGFFLDLVGAGDRVRLVGRHPASPWWAAGAGSLLGEVDLQGAYRLDYRAGPQALTLTGRLLEARLVAEGPYLSGGLTYPAGGELEVDLPLAPLGSRFGGRVHGEGYRVEGVLAGGVGRIGVKGRLLPLEGELTLEETALEDFLARYAPYLKGRVSGRLRVAAREAQGEVAGFVEVSGKRLPLSLRASLAPGRGEGEGRIGESPFRLGLEGDRVDLSASPRAFPLHLLLAAVAGPLEGEAYWTGAVRLRFPLSDPRRGEGVLVGESLVFRGGGDELRGRAAFRYGGETLYVDHLRLSGKGLWEGGGYWSPRGSDLYLNLKDTAFTPVLQVIPALKPYRPEASGTLALRLTQEGFQVQMEAFRFRLGPVAGYLPNGLLALNGGARAEGEITLTAPFPGRGRLGLEGTLDSFQVSAKGAVSLPGLKEDTPAEVSFRYPTYGVALRLGQAEAEGTLFPLRLAGYGRLPLSYPQYYLQDGLLDVKSFFLYEEKGTYHLTGNAEVLRARLAIPEASARNLSSEGVKVAEKPAPVPLVFEGVRLFAERGVLVQESLAQGELKGEVYLGGTYQDPFLTGEVQALWGSFRLWDSLFTLDPASSRLQFSPDRGLLPRFTLKAKAETRGYQVFLSAEGEFVRENGRVKVRLTPRFTSEPPLSEPEIYALLTLGTPDATRLAETLPQAALGAALENLVLGQLERELAKAFGLDRFQVEVPLFQGGGLGETRFSIGKYLSPELFLGYQVDLRGQQTFSAQYRRDGLTFTLGTTFQFGDGRLSRLDFALGYDLTSSLAVSLGLEASDTVRFSVGALYRW
jgi:hypothetical protein